MRVLYCINGLVLLARNWLFATGVLSLGAGLALILCRRTVWEMLSAWWRKPRKMHEVRIALNGIRLQQSLGLSA